MVEKSGAGQHDGRYVLTGSSDTMARLWDAATAKQIGTFKGHGDAVTSVAFSPDGRLVLTGSEDKTARLWNVETEQLIRVLNGHTSEVTSVAVSSDVRFILTGNKDGTARQWSSITGQQSLSLQACRTATSSVAFSNDDHFMLTGCWDGTTALWEENTGQLAHVFGNHQGVVTSVAFSPDGKLLLTGRWYENSAWLWDVTSGQFLRSFEGHTAKVDSVAFSPDGLSVLTGSLDRTARLWDVGTGKLKQTFEEDNSVPSATYSPDGHSMIINSYGTLTLRNAIAGSKIQTFNGHASTLEHAALSADGRFVLAGGLGNTVWLRNVMTGKLIRSFNGHTKTVESIALSPDGHLLATGSSDNTARLWNVDTGEQIHLFEGHSGAVRAVAFSPDGRSVLTGSWDTTARLWEVASGKELQSFQGHMGMIYAVAFSPDGRFISTGGSGLEHNQSHGDKDESSLQIWDVATGKRVQALTGYKNLITSIAASRNGKYILTGGFESTARLWDASTGQLVRSFEGHTDMVISVAFSPDDRLVLTGSYDNTARLWDATTTRQIRSLPFKTAISSVSFSSDGQSFFIGSLEAGALWDVNTGRRIRYISANESCGINSAALTPDGHLIGGGCSDNTIWQWDVSSGRQLRSLDGHTGSVQSVTYTHDGRFLVTGSRDNTTRLWDPATGKQLATLISFGNGGWAVVDPQGRFDTNDLDGGAPLVWVIDSEPMRALPLEIFMRDYYTPRLLSRIMQGENLPPIRSIAEIKNRVQPEVTIVSVIASKTHSGWANVVVHAASRMGKKTDAQGKVTTQASGLRDLRLFRNGQLVANTLHDHPLENGDFTFTDIQLPTSMKSVTFTAYAFSSERIKSPTAQKVYSYEPNTAVKAHAYLLQIGVNHYQAKGCDLHGSVTDAEELSRVLDERLRARGLLVTPVKLVSDDEEDGATKVRIREALEKIAKEATPDDVFFLSFSGHGYGDKSGQFYILPSDIHGSCSSVDATLLNSAISADELAEWLRPIDAGELTFVLDSCQSASSVEANDFKPGPMGSRGLGQLAYDKRMRILAASQSNQAALERSLPTANGVGDGRTQGLVSYALTELGLVEGLADWKPKDGKITVGEWLTYAADAVPRSLESGDAEKKRGLEFVDAPERAVKAAQMPAVFDFSKRDGFVLQEKSVVRQ
jgi:WD40 repeat protein